MAQHSEHPRFEAADHLEDLTDVAPYLEIARPESGEDPSAIPRASGVIARSQKMSGLARRGGHEPRRAVQGAVGRRQPHLVDHPEGHQRAGLCTELHTVA